MHDAPRRMRGFLPDREPAFQVAVERNAVIEEIADPRGRLARDAECRRFIDNPAADRDGVGGVRLGAVVLARRRAVGS